MTKIQKNHDLYDDFVKELKNITNCSEKDLEQFKKLIFTAEILPGSPAK